MKKILLWLLAVVITIASAVYQRMTGPTYDLRGKVEIGGTSVKYKLPRSHEITGDCEVAVKVANPTVTGYIEYKRLKTEDPWTRVDMERRADELVAFLPKQPAAGKLLYKTILINQNQEISLSGEEPAVIRFKGVVPMSILIPHILVMFLAMLFSTRAGLEALDKRSTPRKFALWAAVLLFIGGFILGPLVQKFAFGAWWTGFPLGFDLTDNKTLVAMVGWAAALVAGRKGKPARGWVLGASLLTLIIFLIPHSLLGSELDYSKMSQ